MKKLLAIILAIVCIIPTMAVSFSVSAAENANTVVTKNVSVYRCQENVISIKKTTEQKKFKFSYSVSNNKDKYIFVDDNNSSEYTLWYSGLKVTGNTKPVITVYYMNGKTKVVVNKYVVTVRQYRMDDILMNVRDKRTVENNFTSGGYDPNVKGCTSYEIDNKKVASFNTESTGYSNRNYVYGKAKGTTKVKVYLTKTFLKNMDAFKSYKRLLLTTFTVKVGNYPPYIKNSYKNFNMNYYSKADCGYALSYSDANININNMVGNDNPNAKYTVTTNGKKVVKLVGRNLISTAVGRSTYTVYATISSKKYKVGNFTVNVRDNNKMVDYALMNLNENCPEYDGEPSVFGTKNSINIEINNSDKYETKNEILDAFAFNGYTGVYFAPSDYTITYGVDKDSTDIISIDNDGVVTALKTGSALFNYTIHFADGSSYKSYQVSVEIN